MAKMGNISSWNSTNIGRDLAQVGNISSWNSTNIGREYFEFTLVPGNIIYYKENEEEY
jgi:hypothetical protein